MCIDFMVKNDLEKNPDGNKNIGFSHDLKTVVDKLIANSGLTVVVFIGKH